MHNKVVLVAVWSPSLSRLLALLGDLTRCQNLQTSSWETDPSSGCPGFSLFFPSLRTLRKFFLGSTVLTVWQSEGRHSVSVECLLPRVAHRCCVKLCVISPLHLDTPSPSAPQLQHTSRLWPQGPTVCGVAGFCSRSSSA